MHILRSGNTRQGQSAINRLQGPLDPGFELLVMIMCPCREDGKGKENSKNNFAGMLA